MSERTYAAILKDRDLKATSGSLAAYRDAYIGGSGLAMRMSELIWFDL